MSLCPTFGPSLAPFNAVLCINFNRIDPDPVVENCQLLWNPTGYPFLSLSVF